MTLRSVLLPLLVAAAQAAPVAAQAANPTGSLTLMSRPAGALFRITGDQEIAGRTPVKLSPWLAGRYRITGSEIGYDRWRREVVFDGMTADTLWMTLRQKTALKAGGRALLLPGWGQLYDQHPRRGLMVLIGAVAAGVGVVVAEVRYSDRVDEVGAAQAAYLAAPTPAAGAAWQRAVDRMNEAQLLRQGFVWSGVGIWGLGVIDAIAFVPRPLRPTTLASGGEGSGAVRAMSDGMQIAVTFGRLGF